MVESQVRVGGGSFRSWCIHAAATVAVITPVTSNGRDICPGGTDHVTSVMVKL